MLRVHAPARRRRGRSPRAWSWSGTRCSTSRPLVFRLAAGAASRCWVTEIRAASFTLAYEVYDETAGRDAGSTCGRDGAHAVRLRRASARAGSPPQERGRAGALPRAGPSRCGAGALEPTRAPRGHYPVHVRFSDVDAYGHVNNVKYFEYFQEARIALSSLHLRRASRDEAARAGWWSPRPTSTTGGRSCSAPSRTRVHLGDRGSAHVVRSIRVRDPRRGRGAARGRGWSWSSFDPRHAAGRAARPTQQRDGSLAVLEPRSEPAPRSLERVDHELRGVGDVVPELRVLLRGQPDLVEAGAEVRAASAPWPSA